jgi:CubicO group peptidase (beta-lactamase class C family)
MREAARRKCAQRRRDFALPILVCLLVLRCGAPAADSETQQEDALSTAIAAVLRDQVLVQLEDAGVPAAALAVVGADGIIWKMTYGRIQGSPSDSVDAATLFAIRSVSKSFTSLAVLMAVQDGLVDLDTPITEYLPEFTVRSRFEEHPQRRMTLRHLLSHNAGFTHETPLTDSVDDDFESYITSISDTWLRFPVGYRLAYANLGTDLAAYILQERSGMPFARYVRQKVLDPLGMTSSSFDFDEIEGRENRVIGHALDGEVVPLRFPEIAAAGLYSSIDDMAMYVRFHLNGGRVAGKQVLEEDLMRQFHEIAFARPGQRTGYGLGLVREVTANTFSLYHEGGGRGFQSLMMIYPELGYGVVLLTNRDGHALTGQPGRAIINGPLIERQGPSPVAEPDTARMRRLEPDEPRITSILGRYGDDNGYELRFENDILGIRVNPENFLPLTFYDDGGELVGFFGNFSELRFLPAQGEQVASLMVVNRRLSNANVNYLAFNGSADEPPGPDKPEWRGYLGEYEIMWQGEPDRLVNVVLNNGYLYFAGRRCVEHEPGLFFTNDGEAIDFRTDPPTAANLTLRKVK